MRRCWSVVVVMCLSCASQAEIPEGSGPRNYRVIGGGASRPQPSSPDTSTAPTKSARSPAVRCEAGEAKQCLIMGIIYEKGLVGMPRTMHLAAKFYRLACNGEVHLGCYNLGVLRENGEGVKRDHEVARRLYEGACQRGEPHGCANLGVMYANGRGVKEDVGKAGVLYARACEGGAMLGCSNLGHAHQLGQGVVKSYRKAAQLYERACQRGFTQACFRRTWLEGQRCLEPEHPLRCLQETSIEAEIVGLLDEACLKRKDMRSCVAYGSYLEAGRFVEKNEARAGELYAQACTKGSAWGCMSQANLRRSAAPAAALKLYERACLASFTSGCREAAAMLLGGDGVERDPVRGLGMSRRACDLGDRRACQDLGVMCTLGLKGACG